MSKQRLILTGHEFREKLDSITDKILCVTCGGKGFYLLCTYGNHKGELVNCEMCEKGFRYERTEEETKVNGKR